MSETIQGSKSSLYTKEYIPGVSDSADSFSHVSVQNLWSGRGALDTINHGLYITTPGVPFLLAAGSVKRKIKIIGHGAIPGDFIRISSGVSIGEEITILKVIDADTLVIAKEINASIGDSVYILKPVTPTYSSDGSIVASLAPPVGGFATLAEQQVQTTALGTLLKPADTLTKVATVDTITNTVTVGGSVSVSNFPATQPVSGSVSVSNFPASQAVTGTFWQATQPVSGTITSTEALKAPTFQEILNLTNIMQTFTAPANSKGCIIQTDDTNSVNIRVKLGGNATSTSGIQFQPGRSEFFPFSGDITVIAESAAANQKISVEFGV